MANSQIQENQPTDIHRIMSQPCHVAAIPFPGRGHINAMLNLCRLLLSKSPSSNLHISVVLTEEWLHLLNNSDDLASQPSNLRFVTIPNVIPSEIGRAKDYEAFIDAVFTKMDEPLERLLDGLQLPVEGIIYDSVMSWVAGTANRRNTPAYSFFAMAASFFSFCYHLDWIRDLASLQETEEEPLANYIPGHNSLRLLDVHWIINSTEIIRKHRKRFSTVKKPTSVLVASFYELEASVVDALRDHLHSPIFPIGPSIPYMMPKSTTNPTYIEWLNSQPNQSVLYISLGSYLSVPATQLDEIAMGIRLSGAYFLWTSREDSESRLQEMAGGKGILVPWCDQMRVLSHPAIGGFLTHCGWNSTMEAVFCGVPMLTLPIQGDQPLNSRLIVDEWKIGLSLKGEIGKVGVVGREEIALVVKKLMNLEGAESREIRRRVQELQDSAHRAVDAGGSSAANIDTFLRELMQL